MHRNSLEAYHAIDINEREGMILSVLEDAQRPMTDRQIMENLGFTDPNRVRPRITDLVKKGLLIECASVRDHVSRKYVRTTQIKCLKQTELFIGGLGHQVV